MVIRNVIFLLDSSLDDLSGGTVDGVHTVSAAVLFVVQEPARVRQTPDLDVCVTQLLQELRYWVHVQQHPSATRTVDKTHACTQHGYHTQKPWSVCNMDSPASSQQQYLSIVQTLGEQVLYNFLYDQ